MRLHEITDPDPEAERLAREVAPCYERVFRRILDCLAANPPSGLRVDPKRRIVWAPAGELVGHRAELGGDPWREAVAEFLRERGAYRIHDWEKGTAVGPPVWRGVREVVAGVAAQARRRGEPDAEAERFLAEIDAGRRPDRIRGLRAWLRRRGWKLLGETVESTRPRIERIARIIARVEAEGNEEARRLARAVRRTFENAPTRRGAAAARRGVRTSVVLSFDPVETAHMTRGRTWRACTANLSILRDELESLVIGIWLVPEGDETTIDDPVARTKAIPFLRETPAGLSVHFELDRGVYGGAPPWFRDAAREILDRIRPCALLVPGQPHEPRGRFQSFTVPREPVVPGTLAEHLDAVARGDVDFDPRAFVPSSAPFEFGKWVASRPREVRNRVLAAIRDALGERPRSMPAEEAAAALRIVEALAAGATPRIRTGAERSDLVPLVVRGWRAGGGRPDPFARILASDPAAAALVAVDERDAVAVLRALAERSPSDWSAVIGMLDDIPVPLRKAAEAGLDVAKRREDVFVLHRPRSPAATAFFAFARAWYDTTVRDEVRRILRRFPDLTERLAELRDAWTGGSPRLEPGDEGTAS